MSISHLDVYDTEGKWAMNLAVRAAGGDLNLQATLSLSSVDNRP